MSKLLNKFAADCLEAGVTPRQVLRKASIHDSLWWKWQTGKVSPTLRSFEAVTEKLDELRTEAG